MKTETPAAVAVSIVIVALFAACAEDDSDGNDDAGADADSDTDADTDADTDTDTDTDGDTDEHAGTDTDTELDSGPPGDTANWVAAGYMQTCAVVEGGYVKCWGYGQFGELGYGYDLDGDADADLSLPSTLPFVRVGEGVVQLDTGINTTCALLADGGVKCWGAFDYEDLGIEVPFDSGSTIGLYDVPADYDPVYIDDTAAVQIDVGGGQMCAVLDTGNVRCHGNGDYMWTGGDAVFDSPATGVCTGVDHVCAVLESGDVYCWGLGYYGALGYGDTNDHYNPSGLYPVDVGGAATQVACGYDHTCALLDTGEVVCWGQGGGGALGYGNTDDVGATDVPSDVGVVDVGGVVTRIDSGMAHTCALLSNGAIRCWGSGGYGRLGYGNDYDIGDDETPAEAGDVPLL